MKTIMERAAEYVEKNHSDSSVSDFQAAMNIAVMKGYVAACKDIIELMRHEASVASTPQAGYYFILRALDKLEGI